MDDSDITFDEDGVCNHCHKYDAYRKPGNYIDLDNKIQRIKEEGRNKEWDCVAGLSGGTDSSFTLHLIKEMGLRPLVVHLDNGWNTEESLANIHAMHDKVVMLKVKPELFRRVQLAFLRGGTPDIEVPTDHAIWATLMWIAELVEIRTIVTGVNHATESHLPGAWGRGHRDWRYIKSITHADMSGRLNVVGQSEEDLLKYIDTFPHYGIVKRALMPFTFRWLSPLDYIDYNKEEATRTLEKLYDWKRYGGKHHESVFTRFLQCYILPRKFGIDKRRSHLSSLICSGQMTRDAALAELQRPPYPEDLLEQDKKVVLEKLQLSEREFDLIMRTKPRTFNDYPSYEKSLWFKVGRSIWRMIR